MQVLRRGGEYLEAREYWRWVALAVVLATVLVAVAITFRHGPVASLITVLLFWLVGGGRALRRIVPRIRVARKGRLGEKLVTDLLAALPDEYYLVNDVVLGAENVDHIVTGPCGVVVIETKRIAGRIRCAGDQWFVNDRRTKSYSRQAKAAAIAVRTYLADQHPELKTVFVRPVVVFTEPHCELSIDRAEVAVARFSELLPLISELGRSRQMQQRLAHVSARSLASRAGSR
jgi:Nuclease-related domain